MRVAHPTRALLENVANLEKSKVEALLAQCAKNTTKDVGKMASRFGKSPKEIRNAIERIKQDNLPRGGPNRNPDVRIDSRGNAYPETPNGVGDTIGNILDYLQ